MLIADRAGVIAGESAVILVVTVTCVPDLAAASSCFGVYKEVALCAEGSSDY